MTFASILFTLLIVVVLMRVFILKSRMNSIDSEGFKALPKEVALAVLKEKLLTNPTVRNLNNLKEFSKRLNYKIDFSPYEAYRKEQENVSKHLNAIELDNLLFEKQSTFLDSILPPEYFEAEKAKAEGNIKEFVERSLVLVSRFYSDKKIEETLKKLQGFYPNADFLIEKFEHLKQERNESLVDEKSIENLVQLRNDFYNTVESERKKILAEENV